jgi:hypothetical protein
MVIAFAPTAGAMELAGIIGTDVPCHVKPKDVANNQDIVFRCHRIKIEQTVFR